MPKVKLEKKSRQHTQQAHKGKFDLLNLIIFSDFDS